MRPDMEDYDELTTVTDDLPRSRAMSWLVLTVAVGGFAALAYYAYHAGTRSARDGEMLIVQADQSPIKEAPTNPQGEDFANKDKTIYDVIAPASQTTTDKVEKLLPEPEKPVSQTRESQFMESAPAKTQEPSPAAETPAATTFVNKNASKSSTSVDAVDVQSLKQPAPATAPAPAPATAVTKPATPAPVAKAEPAKPAEAAKPAETAKVASETAKPVVEAKASPKAEPKSVVKTATAPVAAPKPAPAKVETKTVAATAAPVAAVEATPVKTADAQTVASADNTDNTIGAPTFVNESPANAKKPSADSADKPADADKKAVAKEKADKAKAKAESKEKADKSDKAKDSDAKKPAAKATGGSYKIQLGAYQSEEEAQASWKKISGKFSSLLTGAPTVTEVELDSGTFYRLRTAGFADAAAAKAACAKIAAAKQPCMPVGK